VVPIAAPALIKLGVDPIWLGVMIGMNLQTSFLTPPFGFALFYLRGVAGRMLATLDIYRGAIPFVALQMLAGVLLWTAPGLATYLPDRLFADAAPRSEDERGPACPARLRVRRSPMISATCSKRRHRAEIHRTATTSTTWCRTEGQRRLGRR
jgi:hypothetical protein